MSVLPTARERTNELMDQEINGTPNAETIIVFMDINCTII
jgi:hypothetical protein